MKEMIEVTRAVGGHCDGTALQASQGAHRGAQATSDENSAHSRYTPELPVLHQCSEGTTSSICFPSTVGFNCRLVPRLNKLLASHLYLRVPPHSVALAEHGEPNMTPFSILKQWNLRPHALKSALSSPLFGSLPALQIYTVQG